MWVWWRWNSVRCRISGINCVWNLLDALFTQISPHTQPRTFHAKFRTFLPPLTLFVFHFSILFCSHLFVSLNSFYHDFSQLTFQSISQLFTDLILCGICKLAFGFRPPSQQIFVFGLFCSYLTADQQWLCFVVLLWDCMCVPIVLSGGIVFQLISEIQLSIVHVALLMGENSPIFILFVYPYLFF